MKNKFLILFLVLFLTVNFSATGQNYALQNNRSVDDAVQTGNSGGNVNGGTGRTLDYCNPPPEVSNVSYRRENDKAFITFKTPSVSNLSHFVARISVNPYLGSDFDHWGELIPNLPLPMIGATQTIEISFLNPNQKYYFGLKLFNNCGGQSYLMIMTLEPITQTTCLPPNPISNITVKREILKSFITFKTPNVNNLSRFVIRIATSNYQGSGFDNWGNLVNHNLIPNPNSYQTLELNNLNPYNTYYVGVKLFNNCGAQSELAVITLPAISSVSCLPLFHIKNLTASATINTVTLTWQNPKIYEPTMFTLKNTSTTKYSIEIRKSLKPINNDNFNQAELVVSNLKPLDNSTQSFTISNLNSNTTYYFALVVKNNCDQATDVYTVSIKTLSSSVGGGGSVGSVGGGGLVGGMVNQGTQIPKNYFILINNNEEVTYNRNVLLTLYAENAKEMMISNYPDFRDGYWLEYKTLLSWFLTEEFGEKKVYAKFRSSNNVVSEIVFDSILYLPFPEEESTPVSQEEEKSESVSIVSTPSIKKETNFNQLMVNWLSNDYNDLLKHDLNNDKKIDYKDVKIFFSNWQNLEIKESKDNVTNLALEPKSKIYVEKDGTIKIILVAKPLVKDRLNYTAQVVLNYPAQVLELKEINYGKDFVPIIGIKDYDVYDKEKGLIIKTAGIPFGFKEEKVFAILTFKAKTNQEALINVTQGFVLDSNDSDLLKDVENNVLVSVLVDPVKDRNLFTALVLNTFKISQILAYLVLFLIFVLIYALILLFRKYYPLILVYLKRDKKTETEVNEEKVKKIHFSFDTN